MRPERLLAGCFSAAVMVAVVPPSAAARDTWSAGGDGVGVVPSRPESPPTVDAPAVAILVRRGAEAGVGGGTAAGVGGGTAAPRLVATGEAAVEVPVPATRCHARSLRSRRQAASSASHAGTASLEAVYDAPSHLPPPPVLRDAVASLPPASHSGGGSSSVGTVGRKCRGAGSLAAAVAAGAGAASPSGIGATALCAPASAGEVAPRRAASTSTCPLTPQPSPSLVLRGRGGGPGSCRPVRGDACCPSFSGEKGDCSLDRTDASRPRRRWYCSVSLFACAAPAGRSSGDAAAARLCAATLSPPLRPPPCPKCVAGGTSGSGARNAKAESGEARAGLTVVSESMGSRPTSSAPENARAGAFPPSESRSDAWVGGSAALAAAAVTLTALAGQGLSERCVCVPVACGGGEGTAGLAVSGVQRASPLFSLAWSGLSSPPPGIRPQTPSGWREGSVALASIADARPADCSDVPSPDGSVSCNCSHEHWGAARVPAGRRGSEEAASPGDACSAAASNAEPRCGVWRGGCRSAPLGRGIQAGGGDGVCGEWAPQCALAGIGGPYGDRSMRCDEGPSDPAPAAVRVEASLNPDPTHASDPPPPAATACSTASKSSARPKASSAQSGPTRAPGSAGSGHDGS